MKKLTVLATALFTLSLFLSIDNLDEVLKLATELQVNYLYLTAILFANIRLFL